MAPFGGRLGVREANHLLPLIEAIDEDTPIPPPAKETATPTPEPVGAERLKELFPTGRWSQTQGRIGLRTDGTVLSLGDIRPSENNWTDICKIMLYDVTNSRIGTVPSRYVLGLK